MTTFVKRDELTLDPEQIAELAVSMVWESDLMFQSRVNRDAVYTACVGVGMKVRKRSTGHQILDPRYTVEGRGPDLGLANAYDTSFGNLYILERG